MEEIYIHPHALKHGIDEDEIKGAWENFVAKTNRLMPHDDQIICVGFDPKNQRPVQLIAVKNENGIMIYHAMTPPQKSFLKELGIVKQERIKNEN